MVARTPAITSKFQTTGRIDNTEAKRVFPPPQGVLRNQCFPPSHTAPLLTVHWLEFSHKATLAMGKSGGLSFILRCRYVGLEGETWALGQVSGSQCHTLLSRCQWGLAKRVSRGSAADGDRGRVSTGDNGAREWGRQKDEAARKRRGRSGKRPVCPALQRALIATATPRGGGCSRFPRLT